MMLRLAATAFAIVALAVEARAQVLIIFSASPQYGADVQTKLNASGLAAGTATLFDAQSATPTLATLQEYKAVLVFSDSGFLDPIGLGDALASYVDLGGGVVEAVFANTTGLKLSGRWESGGYSPFVYGPQTQDVRLTLGTIHEPNHPIMSGVTTLDGGSSSYRTSGTLRASALRIADWSNAEPLAAQSTGVNGRVISLNFYPPSADTGRVDFWQPSTHGTLLLANSLDFVAIPEPATWALLAFGAVWVGFLALRRRC